MKARFNHSLETIHFNFYEVLRAVMKFSKEAIVLSFSYNTNPNQIMRHLQLRKTYKAVIPTEMQVSCKGRRRGECYNVLAICDFDWYSRLCGLDGKD